MRALPSLRGWRLLVSGHEFMLLLCHLLRVRIGLVRHEGHTGGGKTYHVVYLHDAVATGDDHACHRLGVTLLACGLELLPGTCAQHVAPAHAQSLPASAQHRWCV